MKSGFQRLMGLVDAPSRERLRVYLTVGGVGLASFGFVIVVVLGSDSSQWLNILGAIALVAGSLMAIIGLKMEASDEAD
ncbi:hypothetical protein LCGC14_0509950 [marine sediment metagenome]|uniref:Uncharacterized protein n=1 Tax=marine sediment metagenome TaxID=412755 RepID=A0A0F9S656_9ZZZZ